MLFIAAWSAAAAGHALATGVVVLAILRFLLGLGEAGKWPAGGKAISEWFPKHRRAFAMGVLDGGSAIGAIIAQPMVAAIAIFWGWRAAFLITGLLGFVWLIGWLAIYQRPGEHPWLSEADRAKVLEETGAHAGPARKRGYLEAIKPLLGVRQLWGLMGARMLATPVWWFYVFWLPDYLSKERGFTLKEIGMFGWIPFLTVDIGKLVGGAASDRLRARGRSARCRARALRATSRSFAIQPSYYAYRNDCALFAAEHDSVQCGMPQERLEALRSCPPGGRPDPGSHGV
ncbi:MAG: MFS transporter [Bryobacteraceae bacterium]|nr:MFS transporter [Bryobacteraceae bacterium]